MGTDKSSKNTYAVSHDSIFKATMQDLATARDFLHNAIPEHLRDKVDLNYLESVKTSFITEVLRQRHADVLYKSKINGEDGYFYCLVEHQSTPDKWMPLRLLEYLLIIMRHHQTKYDSQVLPLVVPIVFYTGADKYSYSLDIFDLFAESNKSLAKSLLLQPATLIDLSRTSDNEIVHHQRAALLELLMKYVWQTDVDHLFMLLNEVLITYFDLEGEHDIKIINRVLKYYLERAKKDQADRFLEKAPLLAAPVGGEIMSIARELERRGYEKGERERLAEQRKRLAEQRKRLAEQRRRLAEQKRRLAEQKRRLAERKCFIEGLFAESIDISVICRVTGLSQEEIRKIVES